MTELPAKIKTDFASAKFARPILAWLKREAARKGLPMYELVEELVARGGPRPWVPQLPRRARNGSESR